MVVVVVTTITTSLLLTHSRASWKYAPRLLSTHFFATSDFSGEIAYFGEGFQRQMIYRCIQGKRKSLGGLPTDYEKGSKQRTLKKETNQERQKKQKPGK